METTFWPRVRAHRALCAAAILARAAALIVRRPRVAPVLCNPFSALIAVSNAFTCCAALSRSAFNSAIMSMFASGEDCSKYQKLCGSPHQREQHPQSVVKFLAFLRSAAIDLPAIASYHSLTDGHAVTTRRPDHFPLPRARTAGRRGHGRPLHG